MNLIRTEEQLLNPELPIQGDRSSVVNGIKRTKLEKTLKRIAGILAKTLNKPLRSVEYILTLKLGWFAFAIVLGFVATVINRPLFTAIVTKFVRSTELFSVGDVVITTSMAGFVLGFLLEGMVILSEVFLMRVTSLLSTAFSLFFVIYSWLQNVDKSNIEYFSIDAGRLYLGVLLVVVSGIIASVSVPDGRRRWSELPLLTRLALHVKFLRLKNSNGDYKLNFGQIARVYKIRVPELKNVLIKKGLLDVKYFKQIPFDRPRRPKKQNNAGV